MKDTIKIGCLACKKQKAKIFFDFSEGWERGEWLVKMLVDSRVELVGFK